MRLFHRRRSDHGVSSTNEESFADQACTLIPAEVRMISGCHSEQTSADLRNASKFSGLPNPAGRAGGACTVALLDILYRNETISFQSLLLQLRESLAKKGMSQIPQLTSSRPLETNETPFSLRDGPGKRRALLVGINYIGKQGQLSGCHNDIMNMKNYLVECQGFSPSNILILMDDGKHIFPTRQKIILGLQQLVEQSKPGDNAYFHYSGHGGLLDPEGFNAFKSKKKEYDETLFPVDHERAGQIRDFSLFHHFVKPMAAGVTVTCVFDCCHSGSYRPTPGGTIAMHRNMDTLSNLAFLFILGGGNLPLDGFDDIIENLESRLGGYLDTYQGIGVEEMQEADMMDDNAVQETTDYSGWDGDQQIGEDYMMGDDQAIDVDTGNGFNGSGNYDEGVSGTLVRGEDVDPMGNTDYADAGGYSLSDPGVFVDNDVDTGIQDGAFDPSSMFSSIAGEGDDGGGGDCECGEGLGDILSSILDAAKEFD